MTVTLPKVNNSWLTQLGTSLGQAMQPQQTGSGYFPPAPSASGQAQSQMSAMPSQAGSFLQGLINKLPANQAAINPLQQPITRLGG